MTKNWGVPTILEFPGVKLREEKLEQDVVRMVRRLRPDWRKEDIILRMFSANSLGVRTGSSSTTSSNGSNYSTVSSLCSGSLVGSHGNSVVVGGYTTDKDEAILLKVFFHPHHADGHKEEGLPDECLVEEARIMRIFAWLDMGPRIYAIFGNGMAFEYAVGQPLDYALAVDKNVYPIVARKVGIMHRQLSCQLKPFLADPFLPLPNVFRTLRCWLARLPLRLRDPVRDDRMQRQLPSRNALEREVLELETRVGEEKVVVRNPGSMTSTSSASMPSLLLLADSGASYHHQPITFCHGNLRPSNIIYNATASDVQFVGLDFAGPNFNAFEIAQHFMTLCGSDLNKIGREEFIPAKEFQLRWCQHYVAGFRDVPLHKVDLIEVDRLYKSIQKFRLVFCLQEVIWSLVNVDEPSPAVRNNVSENFDILEYGIKRFQQYRATKYNILPLHI